MANIKIISILCVVLGFAPAVSKSVGAPTPSASVSKSDGPTKTDDNAGKTPKNVQNAVTILVLQKLPPSINQSHFAFSKSSFR